ncbi:MAG: regulator protein, partial [Bryobacterales bacterium]|nr:regulator protein [Bryobacterales bacterium]
MEHTQEEDTSQLADVDHQIAKTPGVAVVGIGASAGGLDAISQFFAALPADTGLAFVFVQHLDPTRDSQLSEILRKISPIPVTEVCDEAVVEANHFYVIPSNKELTVKEGVLRLRPRGEAPTPWFPINAFMASLAEAYGSRAIAVVLSGTGADGAEGLKAVKAACGITFAQSEGTARFSGMPLSAIGTGAVDFVLSPQEIAAELARIGRDPAALRESADFPVAGKDDVLRKILALLRSASQVDFVNYKQSTVRRRIGRRMVVHKLEDPAAYLEYMERHPGEVMELFRDILIHVTSFFREPESFEALMEHVQVYAEKLRPDEIFRVWVAGCATGEEVYSLAICLDEVLRGGGRRAQIQLFGTDISELALQKARRAIYPDAIAADVPPVRLSRYFVKLDEGYQVVKSIREACVFARHDLTIDPPFSRLDLISCRNVLIYMGAPLQQRVFSLFHYGLKRGGTLMLGSAEAVPATSDYFIPLNREHKIFRKNAAPSLVPAIRVPSTLPSHEAEPVTAGLDLQSLVQKTIHNKFAVDGALVRRDMQIVMFLGHMGQYLDPAPGTANLNLVRMVREELAFKIQGLVLSAIEKNAPIREEGLILSRGEESRRVDVEVIPLPTNVPGELYLLVLFEGAGTTAATTGDGSVPVSQEVAENSGQLQQRLHELERDLQQARAHLRSIAEEHEASVEELRASNEEVRSSNEELQSTNEELGTTKEELQSVNEELTTLNEELKTKNAELGSTNDDLKNLFSAANLPVVMV